MTKGEVLQIQKGRDAMRELIIRKMVREAKEIFPVDEVEADIKLGLARELQENIR